MSGVDDALARLRAICLWCPEAVEQETWDSPTFRIRSKIFAMARQNGEQLSAIFKAPPGIQSVLVGADPKRFVVAPYLGPKGWVGMRIDDEPDWGEVESLVRRSYRIIAPKRLAALIP